jgi:uncharacterized protein
MHLQAGFSARKWVLVHLRAMNRLHKFGLVWLLLSACAFAHVQTDDLYAAEVAVADDSAGVRSQGLEDALSQVLVKLSGSADVAGLPGAAKVLGQASSLVQQYRYRLDGSSTPPQRYLWAKFDRVALERAMRQAGVPVWGAQRPRVLMWLATERKGRRSLLNFDTEPQARAALETRAEQRGMPLQLPLMDLQDQAALSAADLWAGYATAIRAASQRYPYDAILTGRLRQVDGGRWRADWTLWEKNGQQDFSSAALPWSAALQSGIDGAQDRLAARYVPSGEGDGPQHLRIRVVGLDSLHGYGRLMQLLSRQEGITRIGLHEVDRDSLTADIWTRGSTAALGRALTLGGELTLQAQPLDTSMPLPNGPDASSQQAGTSGAGDATSGYGMPPRPKAVDMTFRYQRGG